MKLVPADDFELVKNCYLDVIAHTPGMQQHARWEYGKHPTEEGLRGYIERGEMYFLTDGEEIAGMAAVTMYQGEDYESISWQENLENDQVAVVHLLAVRPTYQGKSLGIKMLEEIMRLAVKNGKKALRLDTLKSNIPAQRMYEKAGFSYRGRQRLYAENTGMTDFLYYEK